MYSSANREHDEHCGLHSFDVVECLVKDSYRDEPWCSDKNDDTFVVDIYKSIMPYQRHKQKRDVSVLTNNMLLHVIRTGECSIPFQDMNRILRTLLSVENSLRVNVDLVEEAVVSSDLKKHLLRAFRIDKECELFFYFNGKSFSLAKNTLSGAKDFCKTDCFVVSYFDLFVAHSPFSPREDFLLLLDTLLANPFNWKRFLNYISVDMDKYYDFLFQFSDVCGLFERSRLRELENLFGEKNWTTYEMQLVVDEVFKNSDAKREKIREILWRSTSAVRMFLNFYINSGKKHRCSDFNCWMMGFLPQSFFLKLDLFYWRSYDRRFPNITTSDKNSPFYVFEITGLKSSFLDLDSIFGKDEAMKKFYLNWFLHYVAPFVSKEELTVNYFYGKYLFVPKELNGVKFSDSTRAREYEDFVYCRFFKLRFVGTFVDLKIFPNVIMCTPIKVSSHVKFHPHERYVCDTHCDALSQQQQPSEGLKLDVVSVPDRAAADAGAPAELLEIAATDCGCHHEETPDAILNDDASWFRENVCKRISFGKASRTTYDVMFRNSRSLVEPLSRDTALRYCKFLGDGDGMHKTPDEFFSLVREKVSVEISDYVFRKYGRKMVGELSAENYWKNCTLIERSLWKLTMEDDIRADLYSYFYPSTDHVDYLGNCVKNNMFKKCQFSKIYDRSNVTQIQLVSGL